jgi:hypothetical protein
MGHIIDRFIIHFFASTGVVLALTYALGCLARRTRWPWLPRFARSQVMVAALVVYAASTLREAYDVSQGQTLTKAIFDYVSWAGGCGCSAWGLWRLTGGGK